MRIRIPMRRTVLFGAMFVAALLALVPLRVALAPGDEVLTAREVSGSIWSGRLTEARIGPATLGDLDARLAPLPLLAGRAELIGERDSAAADRLEGALGLSRDRRSIEAASGLVPLDIVFASVPIASIDLTDVTVRFRDEQCDSAQGVVKANLGASANGLTLPSSLSGPIRCDRGALMLPLAAGSGGDGLTLHLFGDGRYEARIGFGGSPPATLRGTF